MGSIGETVSGYWAKLTGKTPQETIAPIQKMLPTGPDVGTAPEPAGVTSGGGRRFRGRARGKKTVKGGKRGRKTQRKN